MFRSGANSTRDGPVPTGSTSTAKVAFARNGGVRLVPLIHRCCCCCSLATGVGVLAVVGFLSGIYTIFTLTSAVGASSVEYQIADAEKTYADTCDGVDPDPSICALMATNVITCKMFRDMRMFFVVQGFVEAAAGMVGMWAVATHNVRGAKLFMWACLPKFLLVLAFLAARHQKFRESGFEQVWYLASVGDIINVITGAYYFKVIWSYYVTIKRRNRAAATAAESSGSIELDGSHSTVV